LLQTPAEMDLAAAALAVEGAEAAGISAVVAHRETVEASLAGAGLAVPDPDLREVSLAMRMSRMLLIPQPTRHK
jgi:hypothetical protein